MRLAFFSLSRDTWVRVLVSRTTAGSRTTCSQRYSTVVCSGALDRTKSREPLKEVHEHRNVVIVQINSPNPMRGLVRR